VVLSIEDLKPIIEVRVGIVPGSIPLNFQLIFDIRNTEGKSRRVE
jgi:hypothetical protein